MMSKSLPEDFHPAGTFLAAGIEYTIVHEGGMAILEKAIKGGEAMADVTFEDLFKAVEDNRDLELIHSIEEQMGAM